MTKSFHLTEREKWFNQKFYISKDIIYHPFTLGNDLDCMLIYIQGLVNQDLLQQHVLEPLLNTCTNDTSIHEVLKKVTIQKQISVSGYTVIDQLEKALTSILEGNVLLLIDNEVQMIAFPLSEYKIREITESSTENVIRGPKDSFVEDLPTNLTILRRKVRSERLTIETLNFGTLTNTETALVYIRGLCSDKLLKEVKQRLSRINIDAVLGTSQLEAYLEDDPYSPFPQIGNTERPDVVAGALLEGRVVLFTDGSPFPIMAPMTFFMMLQSPEDYYQRFMHSTFTRWLRIFFMCISLVLPSFYIAVINFHPEMLPGDLIITIAASREVIPFPAIVEALIMEISFELLREAGLRIPKPLGQTVSILGALIIGTAAVQAGIVSAPMVIIVSLTGISSFIIPHFDLATSLRLLRFPMLFLSSMVGMFGLMSGLIIILFHLCSLRSFGTPYLQPVAPIVFSDWKDTLVRAPFRSIRTRAKLFGTKNPVRNSNHSRPTKPKESD
ncbi:hypothetical protein J2T56_000081 [Natronobacillus azotifigens]|uniref:Spore germination protein n=1 Tax=Natronobacillus azotifigens TaxID=472978 RepID=A0A9J6R8X6_9BACI|nr:spore germination protein [Natronobacillus azotifigens]